MLVFPRYVNGMLILPASPLNVLKVDSPCRIIEFFYNSYKKNNFKKNLQIIRSKFKIVTLTVTRICYCFYIKIIRHEMNPNSISKVSSIISDEINYNFEQREISIDDIVFAIDEINMVLKLEKVRQNQTKIQIEYEKNKKVDLYHEIDFITKRDGSNLIKPFLLKQIKADNEVIHLEEYLKKINANIENLEEFLEILFTKKRVIELNINKYAKVSFFNLVGINSSFS